ncbi:MAG: hypothetical protein E7580_06365 [Ruminococcaceae bacterium]|nr:hypothetical protein [Oscillospiraceae bacterium]
MKKRYMRLMSFLLTVVLLSTLATPFSLRVRAAVLGDTDENGKLDIEDAVYLLFNTNFPSTYPVSQATDFNADGATDVKDAIDLLYHVLFPERYDLNTPPFTLSAGFARHVINPPAGTGLGGYSTATTRLSEEILDDICLSCIAVNDGEETILLFNFDVLNIGRDSVWKPVTQLIEKELGIPAENVLLNASHTHSAPAIEWEYSTVTSYLETVIAETPIVASEAIANLAPAEMKMARTNTQDLGYVRRYLRYDGQWATDTSIAGGTALKGMLDPTVYYHESDPDTQMQILVFDRETEKDIALCNWQCHVTAVGSETGTDVSSDFVGVFRETVEEELGVHCAYFQGAAGSIVPSGKLIGEAQNHEDYVKHGQDLANTMIAAMDDLTPISAGKIEANYQLHKGTIKEDKVANYGKTYNVRIATYSFGEFAIAAVPLEMDHRNGMSVKADSPYTMTFMCGYSNGSHGYLPAASSYPNGAYEVNSTRFVAGTGENIVSDLIEMLDDLHLDRKAPEVY